VCAVLLSTAGLGYLSCGLTYWRDLETWFKGHSRSPKMKLFENWDTISYSHSIVTMAESLAVPTQYTNVTGTHPEKHPTTPQAALNA